MPSCKDVIIAIALLQLTAAENIKRSVLTKRPFLYSAFIYLPDLDFFHL